MICLIGIDLGSRSIKIVQMTGDSIVHHAVYDTITFYRKYGSTAKGSLKINFDELGFEQDQLVATGYGKIAVQVEGAVHIPEIQAHVRGAVFQSALDDFTLLDIGGQDTKVVLVRDAREVDFMTNDRCAASSGRYMENMAAVLGISLDELSSYSEEAVELSSTCAIFGETEIIARIVEGNTTASLAAGVNYALYKRFSTMLRKLSSKIIVLSGGGAMNSALQLIISRETGREVYRLAEPQLNGAIGSCIFGSNMVHE
jgi:predicted CoA-substrate-specific enzyme activase